MTGQSSPAVKRGELASCEIVLGLPSGRPSTHRVEDLSGRNQIRRMTHQSLFTHRSLLVQRGLGELWERHCTSRQSRSTWVTTGRSTLLRWRGLRGPVEGLKYAT